MKKLSLLLGLLVFCFANVIARDGDTATERIIKRFITCMKKDDINDYLRMLPSPERISQLTGRPMVSSEKFMFFEENIVKCINSLPLFRGC